MQEDKKIDFEKELNEFNGKVKGKPIIHKNNLKGRDNTKSLNSIVQIKKKTKLNDTKKTIQYNDEELNNLTYKL